MSLNLRKIMTARPVDLAVYRDYVLEHPKHEATALLFMLPWSVLGGLLGILAVVLWLAQR